jgi:hypothetical protein
MNMTDNRDTAEVPAGTAARIEDIYRAAIRIEDAVARLAAGTKGVADALERLSPAIGEIRNAQDVTEAAMRAVREEVGALLSARSGGFIDTLGPGGLR